MDVDVDVDWVEPEEMKVWHNRSDMLDFDMLNTIKPTQSWLCSDHSQSQPSSSTHSQSQSTNGNGGVGVYETRQARFQNVNNLTIHLLSPSSSSSSSSSSSPPKKTRLDYLAVYGDWKDGIERHGKVMIGVYEARANPADHLSVRGGVEQVGGIRGVL